MRIIVFVGSPVGSEEKEVLQVLCACMHCISNHPTACTVGQEAEEGEGQCGHYQLRRRGKLFLFTY